MPVLSDYADVYNTALNILDKKGFRIWYDKKIDVFCAEKDGWDFMADSPCDLLGLIAIYEYKKPTAYKEYWWRLDDKSLYREMPTEKPSYISVTEKK